MNTHPQASAEASTNIKAAKSCSTGGCADGGCGDKLNSYDWLAYEGLADLYPKTHLLEVRFKGGRKEFYRNTTHTELITGDPVVAECASGWHVGYVSLSGPLVELQMRKKKVEPDDESVRTIVRKASERDLARLAEARNRELPALFKARQVISQLNLPMKLSDIEFQADGSKAAFYYSSEQRVDFRDLIKLLAAEFKIRVEMRQISMRQEAGRLGGIGVCGRELCCSTWLTDFKSVTTSAARYQNLSLNPLKLSGQCGRLKCCLNYELETYMTEMRDIPKVDKALQTEKGEALLQKTDIFRKLMWFNYRGESTWHEVPAERASMIVEMNRKGERPKALTLQEELDMAAPDDALPINHDLERMDEKFKNRDRRNRDQRRQARPAGSARPQAGAGSPNPQGARPARPARPQQPGAAPQGPAADSRPPRPDGPRRNRNRPRGGKPPGPAGA